MPVDPRPPAPPEADLRAVVARATDADPGALRLQRVPWAKCNATWFVRGAARPMVLRVAGPRDPDRYLFYERDAMRQEPDLHRLLRERTTIPVAEVIAHRWQDPALAGRDWILLARLPGEPLDRMPHPTSGALERALRETGACLRQAHAITGARHGYAGAHAPMAPAADWPSAFAVMWNRLIDDIERAGGYRAEEAGAMRRRLDRHARAFERPVAASLLHMDVWARNLLVSEGGALTGLLDWDRALWGDPEIEFAVLDYCGISEPAFWDGYGARRDDSPEARVRRAFYFLYELQKYVVIRIRRYQDRAAAEPFRRESLRLASAL